MYEQYDFDDLLDPGEIMPISESMRVDEQLEELRSIREAQESTLSESRTSSKWVIATFVVSCFAAVISLVSLVLSMS